MLKPGSRIPNLKGLIAHDEFLHLHELKGKFVVIYFYPKDNTAGCTTESQQFRDLHEKFKRRNAVVIGVSRDSLRSHENFRTKHSLPFALIADTDEIWCRAFDVIREKQLYGRHYIGIERSTFLLDPHGKILREWRKVKVAGHAQAVLDELDTAQAQ